MKDLTDINSFRIQRILLFVFINHGENFLIISGENLRGETHGKYAMKIANFYVFVGQFRA